MKRAILILLLLVAPAAAHVGSPDVFFDGDAGPYPVFVTVRMPQVIPGVADIEVRAPGARDVNVVSMQLTGPGSELPPAPDRAERSADDPQFFTARLWLMERGSLQVRIDVDGPAGHGTLAIPIPAAAQRTLGMDASLGAVLFVLMVLLALAFVSIAGAAVSQAALEPGATPPRNTIRNWRIAVAVASVLVLVTLYGGARWWASEAASYERTIARPWNIALARHDCALSFPPVKAPVMLDHGHPVHLFVVREPALDVIAHLHPQPGDDGYTQSLPSLPAGRYAVFADVVLDGGYPITGTAELDVPDLHCDALVGDDAVWRGEPAPDLTLDPVALTAGRPVLLTLHATGAPLVPYMGMAGHAVIVKKDRTVFAHLHPNGSVAMPALMLAKTPHDMFVPDRVLPPVVSFPYGFPSAGEYRLFVQVRRASAEGPIETASFDLHVSE